MSKTTSINRPSLMAKVSLAALASGLILAKPPKVLKVNETVGAHVICSTAGDGGLIQPTMAASALAVDARSDQGKLRQQQASGPGRVGSQLPLRNALIPSVHSEFLGPIQTMLLFHIETIATLDLSGSLVRLHNLTDAGVATVRGPSNGARRQTNDNLEG